MSDEVIIVVGFLLAVSAIPDIRTTRWMEGVMRRYPSVAIRAYVMAMRVIALVGVLFAVVGLNSSLALLFTEDRTIFPPGTGLFLLLAAAVVLKFPGLYLRNQVRRLISAARASGERDDLDPRVPE